MNEKLVARVAEFVENELAPGETVQAAIRGDLMVSVAISTRPGDALGSLLNRRKLRQAFDEGGLPLPNNFILAVTPTRVLILQVGTGARPKRFVSAVPTGSVAIRLGNRFAATRFAEIALPSGAVLPVRLVHKDDPDEFVEALAGSARGAASRA